MKNITFKGEELSIHKEIYYNGNNALELRDVETGEPFMMASVNIEDKLPDNVILIKDYSENTGILDALVKEGIVRDMKATIPSGYINLNVCELLIK